MTINNVVYFYTKAKEQRKVKGREMHRASWDVPQQPKPIATLTKRTAKGH